MRHERILKRDDGNKVKITASLRIDHRDTTWLIDVETCEPRKRTWVDVVDHDSYEYRRLNMKDREEYEYQQQLLHVTKQEIHDTKVELIKMIPL